MVLLQQCHQNALLNLRCSIMMLCNVMALVTAILLRGVLEIPWKQPPPQSAADALTRTPTRTLTTHAGTGTDTPDRFCSNDAPTQLFIPPHTTQLLSPLTDTPPTSAQVRGTGSALEWRAT